MYRKPLLPILTILPLALLMLLSCNSKKPEDHISKMVKVALRDAGNQLLLTNNDSTSLILPVNTLSKNRYEIAFQNNLSITPDSLVKTIKNSLQQVNLPKRYIVEVVNCSSNKISYSYQIMGLEELNIVPCLGRQLPVDCYTIQILFLENKLLLTTNTTYVIVLCVLIGALVVLLFYKNKKSGSEQKENTYSKIGAYKFFKDQNKLIKDRVEIKLSAKECELMAMFSANQNKVIKREILVKEIWEDNGVFVDRSLDTFISKLRKKFKHDPSINIVNIHGVGYKLEVK